MMLNKLLKSSKASQTLQLIISRYISTTSTTQAIKSRTSYIVILPEVSNDEVISIQTANGLPDFENFSKDKLLKKIGKDSLDYESNIWALEKKITENSLPKKSFEEIVEKLDILDSQLTFSWRLLKTLYVVKNDIVSTEKYIQYHERASKASSHKFLSQPIYQACLELDKDSNLKHSQRRVVQKFLLEGRLNGLSLASNQKESLGDCYPKLKIAKEKYRNNLKEASRKFSYRILDINIVRDFPESLLKNMSHNRSEYMMGPWSVTHQPHVYSGFLEYCPDKDLRFNAWQAYVSRCSLEFEKKFSNALNLEEIRKIRENQAKILGFKNFWEMSMTTKMAKSTDDVVSFLSSVGKGAKTLQEEEIAALKEYANDNGHVGSFDESDVPFWRRMHKRSLIKGGNPAELQKFFPFDHVWHQLLQFCSEMFSIQFEEVALNDVNKWHKDVKFYRVLDDQGHCFGSFFLDPYRRPGEKLHSYQESNWMIVLSSKSVPANTNPSASLVLNFPQLTDGISLLTVSDVQTLFKKLGNTLQHILSTFPYSQASGMTNIEWDAVEVSSNFMLNWMYSPGMLKKLSKHCESGDQLSDDQVDDIFMMRRHMIGYDVCKELIIADIDMQIYSSENYWLQILRQVWPKYSCFPLHKRNNFPCWFQPLVSDSYSAAYYSNLWSKMVAADAYLAFQEALSTEHTAIAKRFRDTFLTTGGGRHSSQVFRDFRNRDPDPEAFQSLYLKK